MCLLSNTCLQEGGLEGLKLYGMVGVPGEGEEDVEATIAMMQQLKKAAPRLRWAGDCRSRRAVSCAAEWATCKPLQLRRCTCAGLGLVFG